MYFFLINDRLQVVGKSGWINATYAIIWENVQT